MSARTATRTAALTGGGVDMSVPRSGSGAQVVSARTGDRKVTVRAAN
ncbi:hypothetical protein AB0937_29225 [Streptomyces sp. NPDC047880]